MRVVAIRLFVSQTCQDCTRFRKAMEMHGFDCEYIDVNEDANDELCDRFNIEEIPVFQAYDKNTGEVIMEHVGYNSPMALMGMLAEEVLHEDVNLNLEGVAPNNGVASRPSRPRKRGCGGCGRSARDSE